MSYSARSKIVPIGTGQNSMSFQFDLNDDVKITDSFHHMHGHVGTVVNRYISNIGYEEYEVKITDPKLWGGYSIEVVQEPQISLFTSAAMKNRPQTATAALSGYSNQYSYMVDHSIVFGVDKATKPKSRYCNHSWKEDFNNPFSINKYYSCRSCGKKKEEHDHENDGVPF